MKTNHKKAQKTSKTKMVRQSGEGPRRTMNENGLELVKERKQSMETIRQMVITAVGLNSM